MSRFARFFITVSLLLLLSFWPAFTIDYTWNGGISDWGTATNWTPNAVPGSGDTVTITSGTCNSMGGNRTIDALTISGSGSLTDALARNLVVEGNVSLSGSGSFSSNISLAMTSALGASTLNSSLTIGNFFSNSAGNTISLGNDLTTNGNLEIGNAGTFNCAGFQINVAGDWIRSGGNFNETNGTVVFTGSGTIDPDTFWNLTINGAGTYTLNGAITVSVDLTINSGTFDASTNQINIWSDWYKFGGTWTSGNNQLVVFDGGGTSTLRSGGTGDANDFVRIQVTGGTTLNLTGTNLEVDEWIQIDGGNTVDISGLSVTNATLTNNGTFRLQGGENLTAMTKDTDSGLVVYDGGGSYTGLAYGNSYWNVRFNGTGTWTLNANITVSRDITLSNGALAAGGYQLTIGDDWLCNGGTFNGGTSTVLLNGLATPQDITLAGNSFNNITINSGASTAQLIDTCDVNGNLSIQGGTFNQNNQLITIAGNWSKTGGVYTSGTGTVQFNNTANRTINTGGTTGNEDFYNLRFSGTSWVDLVTNAALISNNLTIDAGAELTLNGQNITVSGTFSNNGIFSLLGTETVTLTMDTNSGTTYYYGNINITGFPTGNTYYSLTLNTLVGGSTNITLNAPLTVNGNLTISEGNSATLDVSATNHSITVGGNWNVGAAGTFTARSGTVTFTGAATGSPLVTPGGQSFYNFTVNGAGNTVTLGGALDVDNNLTITAGTLDVSATDYQINVGGSWSGTGGAFTYQNGTVVFDGTGNVSAEAFWNFTVNTGGTVTLTGTVDVNQNLTITNGTLDATNRTINVAGNWSNSSSFTNTNSTVTFFDNGTVSTITGTTTFNDFTCTTGTKTIQFEEGVTQTVQGTFTITGTAKNLISLISRVNGNPWTINVSGGPQAVSFALVRDGAVLSNDITANNSRDDGNNDLSPPSPGWIFPPNTLDWEGSLNLDWDTGGNWDLGFVPNTGDTANIPMAAISLPATLGSNTTVNNLNIEAGASADANGFALTVTTSYDNQGTMYRTAAVGESVPIDADSGLVAYRGAGGGTIQDYGTPGTDYYSLEIAGAGTFTLGSDLEVANDLIISGGIFDVTGANYQIILGGSWNNTGGTFNEQNGLVIFDGTGTLSAETFFDLEANTAGTITLAGALDVDNKLTITAGTISAGANTINVAGNWDGSGGVFTAGTGTVTFDGTADQTADPGASAFNNLTYSGSGILTVQNNPLLVNGTLTIGPGLTVDVNNLNITIGTLVNDGKLELDGSQATQSITTADPDSGLILYNGATGGTVRLTQFYDFEIDSAGQTFTLNAAIDVNNNLIITAGTLDVDAANNYQITVGNSWNNTGGIFNEQNGLVLFDGTGTVTAETFYDFEINTLGTITLAGDLDVDHDLTITAGILDVDVANNYQINVGGSWNNTGGTFNEQNGLVVFDGTGTVSAETFFNFEVNTAGAVTLAGTLDVDNDLTITAGILDASANDIYLARNWTNNDQYVSGLNTVYFNGGVAQSLDAGGDDNDLSDFNNLEVNSGFTVQLLTTNCEIDGTLTITGNSTWDMGLQNLDLGGNLSIALGSSWTKGSGLLTLEGALSLTDSNAVANDLGDTLVTANPVTQTTAIQVTDLTINAAQRLDSAGFNLSVSGNWDNNGEYVSGLNTVYFNGGVAQSLDAGGDDNDLTDFNNLEVNSGFTVQLLTTNCEIDGTLTITGNSTWDMGLQNLDLGGNLSIALGSSWTKGSGLLTLEGALSLTDSNAVANDLGDTLVTANPVTQTTAIQVTDLTINAAQRLDSAGFNLSVSGNWDNNGEYVSGLNTVYFNGGVAQSLDAGGDDNDLTDFNNLEVNSGFTVQLLTTNCEIDGTLTITGNSTWDMGLQNLDLGGNLSIALGSSWTKGSGLLTLEGALSLTDSNAVANDLGDTLVTANPVTQTTAIQVTDLTINAAQRLDSAGFNLSVSGNWDNNGEYVSGLNIVTFNAPSGTVTIETGGILDTQDFNDLVFNDGGGGTTFQLITNDLDVDGDLTITGGRLDAGAITNIYIAGNWTNNDEYVSSTNVYFDGGVAQSLNAGGDDNDLSDFNNLEVNSGFTVQLLTTNCEIDGTLTITGNSTWDMGLQNLDLGGNLSIALGSSWTKGSGLLTLEGALSLTDSNAVANDLGDTLVTANPVTQTTAIQVTDLTINAAQRLDSAGFNLSVSGNWDNNGEYVSGLNTVYFNGGVAQSLDAGGDDNNLSDFNNLEVNSGFTVQLLTTNCEIDGTLTITGNSTWDMGLQNLDLGGNLSIALGSSWTKGSGLLTLEGALSLTDSNPVANDLGDTLVTANPVTQTTAIQVTDLTINAAQRLDSAGFNLSVSGNWDNNGEYVSGLNTVYFNGGVAQSLDAGGDDNDLSDFNNLEVNSGFTVQLLTTNCEIDGTLTITGNSTWDMGLQNLDLGGNLSIALGSSWTKGSGLLTLEGALSLTDSNAVANDLGDTLVTANPVTQTTAIQVTDLTINAAQRLDSAGFNLSVSGNWDNNGEYVSGLNIVTFNAPSGTVTIETGGILDTQDFNDLVFNDGGGGTTFQLITNDLDVDGDLTITGGRLDAGAITNIYIAGNWTNNDEYVSSTNVYFDGGVAQSLDAGGDDNDLTDFNNLEVNSGFTVQLLTTNCEIDGTLTITGNSTWDMGLQNLDLGGNLSIALGSSWTKGSGLLTLEGALSLTDSNAVANDLGDTLVTANPVTQTTAIQVTDLTINAAQRLDSAGFNLSVSGNWDNNGEYVSGLNTVYFNGGVAQSLDAGGDDNNLSDFNNLEVNSGFTVQLLTTNCEIDGTLTITGNSTWDMGLQNLDLGGNLSIAAGSSWTKGSGLLTLEGALSLTDSNAVANDLGDTLVTANPVTQTTAIQVTDLTINAAQRLDSAGFNLSVSGNWDNNGEYVSGLNIVTFNAPSGTVTIETGGTAATQDFNNVIFDDAGGGATFQLITNDIDVNGNLTITGGTFDTDDAGTGRNIYLAGNWTNNDIYISGTNTVTFNTPSGTVTIETGGTAATQDFNNVIFDDAGGGTTFQLITNDIDVNGNLTITGGTFDTDDAGTGRNIYLAGNWTNNDIYISGTNTVYFNGGVVQTVDAGGLDNNLTDFSNVEVNTGSTVQLLNTDIEIDGTLTITGTSTLEMNNLDIDLGGNLTIDNLSTWIKGTGTLTFEGNLSVTDNNPGPPPPNDLGITVVDPTFTVTQQTVMQVTDLTIDGTLNSNNSDLYVLGSWDNNGSYISGANTVTFNAPSGTVTIETGGILDTQDFNNVVFDDAGGGATFQLITNELDVDGNLTITAGTLDPQTLTLYVEKDWTNNGIFVYDNGWVIFDGQGDITTSQRFYNVRKDGVGTLTTIQGTSNLTITVISELHIAAGTLVEGANTNTIILGDEAESPATVYWDNDVVVPTVLDGFNAGDGLVDLRYTKFEFQGSTTFNDFTADINNLAVTAPMEIRFEADQEQAINGDMYIRGIDDTVNMVFLLSASGNAVEPTDPLGTTDPNPPDDGPPAGSNLGTPGGGPCPTPYTDPILPFNVVSWRLTIVGTADIDFAAVQLSHAVNGQLVTPGLGSRNLGYNCNWAFVIPILRSWTVDTNRNGRIDRIRVQVLQGTTLSDDLNGVFTAGPTGPLQAEVDGYAVVSYHTGDFNFDDVFDIILQEGQYLDTDATPSWRLTQNNVPGLYGQAGGAYVEAGPTDYHTVDGARPVIGYTLAVLGERKAYLHFSEPVYGDATASSSIDKDDFSYSGANPLTNLELLETTGNGAHAARLEFTNPLSAADILPGGQTIAAVANSVYQKEYPPPPPTVWPENQYPTLALGPDPTDFPGANDAAGVDNLPWPDNTVRNTPHNISDVGLGFIEPVWAANVEADGITPIPVRDPLRGGIGRITHFDGREQAWLQDRDVRLQANIIEPSISGNNVTLYFDVNTSDPILLHNLWIPPAATLFVPGPPPPAPPTYPGTPDSDTFHNENSVARPEIPVLVSGALRDFIIPSTDPEIEDGADVELMFVIDVGGILYPFARIPNLQDPRTARPWVYKVRDLRTQRGEATITNNVINPLRGETVKLTYSITQTGMVTINVFDLKGDIVDVLYRGQRTAGEYSTSWDGRNRGNRVVARGVYFIKIVGPGINEIRKVLVVK